MSPRIPRPGHSVELRFHGGPLLLIALALALLLMHARNRDWMVVMRLHEFEVGR